MISIDDFLESTWPFDRIIQLSLRDIDTRDLAIAMLGYSDERQGAVLRNMSKRGIRLLQDEMEIQRDQAPDHQIQTAKEFFEQRLRAHARYVARSDTDVQEKLAEIAESSDVQRGEWPTINLEDEEGIVNTFVAIQSFVRKHGTLALDGLETRIGNPLMRKGFEYLVDGWEPLLLQSILETYKKAYLERMEKQLNMILEGIDSLAAKDLALVTEERLRAHLS